VPLKRRAAPRSETMLWDGSAWQKALADSPANPNLRVAIYKDGTYAGVLDAQGDNITDAVNSIVASALMYGHDGTNWDRWRSNTEVTVLPSGTRTASGNSPDQTNYNARGVIVNIDVTAVSGTFATGEGLHIVLSGKDPLSGRYFWLSPRIGPYTTTGHRQILVYPGATDTAGWMEGKNDIPLTRTWRIHYDITGTNPSFTFSVGAMYIV